MAFQISKGKKKKPLFTAFYGPPGSGKSTVAAEAPNPIFLDIEKGTAHINTSRIDDIKSWDDIFAAVKHFRETEHPFKSFIVDSVTAAEPLLLEKICKEEKVKTISEAFGGYGKGYEYAVTQWVLLLKELETLREKGMNVILIGHSEIKVFNDPNQQLPYDRYVLKMNEKCAAKIREAVDSLLFVNFEDSVFKLNRGDKKAKVIGGDVRKIYTQRKAAYDAKDRLGLPPEIALSWAELEKYAQLGQPDSLENIKKSIDEIILVVTPDLKEKISAAAAKAGDDSTQLLKILNHARMMIE